MAPVFGRNAGRNWVAGVGHRRQQPQPGVVRQQREQPCTCSVLQRPACCQTGVERLLVVPPPMHRDRWHRQRHPERRALTKTPSSFHHRLFSVMSRSVTSSAFPALPPSLTSDRVDQPCARRSAHRDCWRFTRRRHRCNPRTRRWGKSTRDLLNLLRLIAEKGAAFKSLSPRVWVTGGPYAVPDIGSAPSVFFSIRLRIWGSGVRISSGAPVKTNI